jgi:hypothetical protein
MGGTGFGIALAATAALAPVNCGTGLGVYGTAVALIGATAMPMSASGLLVSVWNVTGGAVYAAISIGYGLTPAVQTIIPHLMVQPSGVDQGYDTVYLPVSVPPLTAVTVAGTANAACTMYVTCIAIGSGSQAESPLSVAEPYSSFVTSGYQGIGWTFAGANVESDPATSLGTTTRPVRNLIIAFGSNADATRGNTRYLVNIYADGLMYMESIPVMSHSGPDDIRPKYVGPIPVSIPAGVVLSATVRRSTVTATDSSFRMAVYGVS